MGCVIGSSAVLGKLGQKVKVTARSNVVRKAYWCIGSLLSSSM